MSINAMPFLVERIANKYFSHLPKVGLGNRYSTAVQQLINDIYAGRVGQYKEELANLQKELNLKGPPGQELKEQVLKKLDETKNNILLKKAQIPWVSGPNPQSGLDIIKNTLTSELFRPYISPWMPDYFKRVLNNFQHTYPFLASPGYTTPNKFGKTPLPKGPRGSLR